MEVESDSTHKMEERQALWWKGKKKKERSWFEEKREKLKSNLNSCASRPILTTIISARINQIEIE